MPTTSIPADQVLAPGKTQTRKTGYRTGTKKARLLDLLAPAKGVTVDHLAATLGYDTGCPDRFEERRRRHREVATPQRHQS